MRKRLASFLFAISLPALVHAQTPDWTKINDEAMRHFQALVRIDSTDPPGKETKVVEYVKQVLDAEGIPSVLIAKDPARANLIARLKGNGSKKPLLIMGHSDTVKVDPPKWIFPPFSATRDGGFVYGRGTLDDKSDLLAAMMTMLMLKRANAPLDRDVIFVSEAGEEAATGPGIEFLVNEHWSEIEAEICLAESGGVRRRGGKPIFATVETTEKQPRAARLVVKGPAGHGSNPLQTSAILHLARAVDKVASWEPPARFNDTTRSYFEKLANISPPEDAARYKGLFDSRKAPAIRQYFAKNEPATYSSLHTSISPNIIQAGYQVNVIPSEAEATLDIRALPDENISSFYDTMRKVIDDPVVELVPDTRNQRPGAAPSSITSDAFHSIEGAYKKVYGVTTLPFMSNGATDMAFLRAKGVQCYGIGAMRDEEDAAKGFGAHSDQERILEDAVYKHVQFFWEAVTSIAG
ncbi:MAG TPA: M20/M25/M40 family metallo-hydrolase, partial [Bryobacteraceae bacterium]|nr:M20/M25/M40 family metallo-hydrolase [Bryobacteraceae bacterium]